jgi:hypothetical protein
MLRDIQHNGETYTVIKENYVIGILSDEWGNTKLRPRDLF